MPDHMAATPRAIRDGTPHRMVRRCTPLTYGQTILRGTYGALRCHYVAYPLYQGYPPNACGYREVRNHPRLITCGQVMAEDEYTHENPQPDMA